MLQYIVQILTKDFVSIHYIDKVETVFIQILQTNLSVNTRLKSRSSQGWSVDGATAEDPGGPA